MQSLRESAPPPAGAPVVLIVEDEPVLRASMVRGLAKLPGVEVLDAGTLQDARELVAAYPPALVVSDLDLPDGSGVELAADLDRVDRRVPIVFVTAYVSQFRASLPDRPGIEIHEKPLALARLRQIVLARLGANEVDVPPFGILDYVQLAGMGRRSVVLEVRGHVTGHGRIVVRQGEVWSAEDERGSGLDAFRRLAFLSRATVSCRAPGEGDDAPRTITGSVEGVLLDAARHFDEAQHGVATGNPGLATAKPARTSSTPPRPGEMDELERGWDDAPPQPPPRSSTIQPHRAFVELVDLGVEALLAKRHAEAYRHFVAANDAKPDDPSVIANLSRLREMGYAC